MVSRIRLSTSLNVCSCSGRELEQAQQRIRELLAKLERKDELLTEANDRLMEAGQPVVDPMNPVSEYTISVPVKPAADKS